MTMIFNLREIAGKEISQLHKQRLKYVTHLIYYWDLKSNFDMLQITRQKYVPS
jgi:hypothetical protein